jgi:hypothetical protein
MPDLVRRGWFMIPNMRSRRPPAQPNFMYDEVTRNRVPAGGNVTPGLSKSCQYHKNSVAVVPHRV